MKTYEYTPEEILTAGQEIDEIMSEFARDFGIWYCSKNDVEYSSAYFERTLAAFTIKFVPAVYHHTLANGGNECGDFSIPVQIPSTVADSSHLIMESDTYHDRTLREICSHGRLSVDRYETFCIERPRAKNNFILRCLSKISLSLKIAKVVLCCDPARNKDVAQLCIRSRLRITPWFSSPLPILKQPDLQHRNSLRDYLEKQLGDATCTDNKRIAKAACYKLIAYHLPISLMELFSKQQEHAARLAKNFLPRRIVTGYGFLLGEDVSFYAAECAERQTEILGWQHGGVYGESHPSRCERMERRISDRFITWGWDDGGNDLVPLPCPRQHLHSNTETAPTRLQSSDTKILWVTTADSRFTHSLDPTPCGKRLLNYFQHQKRLFESLDPGIQEKIVIRLYKRDFGWGLKERWQAIAPNVEFSDHSMPLINEAKHCGITLIDHAGSTSFLECVATGIPTVVAYDTDTYPIRDCFRKLANDLHAAKVFHSTPDALSSTLEEMRSDPLAWLATPARAGCLQQFATRFMRSDKDYLSVWQASFLEGT